MFWMKFDVSDEAQGQGQWKCLVINFCNVLDGIWCFGWSPRSRAMKMLSKIVKPTPKYTREFLVDFYGIGKNQFVVGQCTIFEWMSR